MSEPKQHAAVAVVERAGIPDRMHPMVRAMMGQVADPKMLGELMQLQRDYQADEARREYTVAMVALKNDLPTVIGKDAAVKFNNVSYRHASLAAVVDAVTGIMARHGFSISCPPSTEGKRVTVTCRITHAGGHHEECSISEDTSGGSAVNGVPGTITRLQRYAILSMLGIATGDMQERHDNIEPDPEKVDTSRNMKAAAALKKYNRTKEEAEKFLGRDVAAWSRADLDRLKVWLHLSSEPNANGDVLP